jgi:hypothetical protein
MAFFLNPVWGFENVYLYGKVSADGIELPRKLSEHMLLVRDGGACCVDVLICR